MLAFIQSSYPLMPLTVLIYDLFLLRLPYVPEAGRNTFLLLVLASLVFLLV